MTTLNSSVGTIVRSALFDAPLGSVTPYAIANDNRGGIYVAGATSSPSFPRATSPGLSGSPVGFVAKFSADLTKFDYSVLLGRTLTGVALRGPLSVFPPEASCAQCFPEIYVAGWDDSTFNDPGSPREAFMVKMVDDTPTSFVTSTAAEVNTNPFTVSWGGSSPLSNVASFDVFVSDNGGPFSPFLTGTTATSAPFTGVPGHTYGFFSIATDTAGIKEPMKTKADVVVKIADVTPPVITPQIAGTLGSTGWYRSAVTVNWTVTDPESGITSSTGCAPTNLTADTAGDRYLLCNKRCWPFHIRSRHDQNRQDAACDLRNACCWMLSLASEPQTGAGCHCDRYRCTIGGSRFLTGERRQQ